MIKKVRMVASIVVMFLAVIVVNAQTFIFTIIAAANELSVLR